MRVRLVAVVIIWFFGFSMLSATSAVTNSEKQAMLYKNTVEFCRLNQVELISLAFDDDRQVNPELLEYFSEQFMETRLVSEGTVGFEDIKYELISLDLYIEKDNTFYAVYRLEIDQSLVFVYCRFSKETKIDNITYRWL